MKNSGLIDQIQQMVTLSHKEVPRNQKGRSKQPKITPEDINQLWTAEDQKWKKNLEENQRKNREKITALQLKLDLILKDAENKLKDTIEVLKKTPNEANK